MEGRRLIGRLDSMKPATTLKQVWVNINPRLTVKKGDEAYVDLMQFRGEAGRSFSRLRLEVERTDGAGFWLVTGHRGTGKTTELLSLKDALECLDWHVIYIDAEDDLDLNDVGSIDILITLVKAVIKDLQDNHLPIPGDGARLETFFSTVRESLEESARTSELIIKGEAEAKADAWFVKLLTGISALMKGSDTVRTSVRRSVEPRFTEFRERIDDFLSQVESMHREASAAKGKGCKGLVFIFDSLEKVPFRQIEEAGRSRQHFFATEADKLTNINAKCIFTVPIATTVEKSLLDDYYGIHYVPVVDPLNPKAFAGLKELVKKRVSLKEVFVSPDKVDEIILASGGSLRDLFHMLRSACSGDSIPVPDNEITYGISLLRKNYARLIRGSDADVLTKVEAKEMNPGDDPRGAELLSLRVIMEYAYGENYFKVHPLLVDSLKK